MKNNEYRELEEWKGNDASPETDEVSKRAVSTLGKIFDFARESKITKREIERYRAERDIAITEITQRYKFAHALMNKTFEERRMVIEKHFEIIDKGLETGNYDLVNTGLANITAIVKDNPFKLFQVTTVAQRRKMLEDGDLSVE